MTRKLQAPESDVDALSRFRGDGLAWNQIFLLDVNVARFAWRDWICTQETAGRIAWHGGRWRLTAFGADFLRGIA
jgi:hypothetical protein